MEMDWKKMGFKSKEDYDKFFFIKTKDLMDKIKHNPELLDVFKGLKDK